MSGKIAWISLNSDMPSIGVMRRSVTVMSVFPLRTISMAALPSRADSTT